MWSSTKNVTSELILKSDPVDPNQDWGRTSMLGLSLHGKMKNA